MSFYIFIYILLLLLLVVGLAGLMLFESMAKKVSCLSLSYISFMVLFMVISLKNYSLENIFPIAATILMTFSINMLIMIGILRK